MAERRIEGDGGQAPSHPRPMDHWEMILGVQESLTSLIDYLYE